MDLVISQDVTINNPELKKITGEIRKAGANVIGNTYKIASLIAYVDKNELYGDDGFENTFDYVKQCFGLEKASAYNLIKIGNEFIEGVKSGNSTTYQTLLTHGDKDFSISQVIKMLPLGIDKAKELTADGVIDETMSCRQIEKIVKENTDGTKARGKAKKDPEPEEPKDEEPKDNEPEDVELLIEYDAIPESVIDWLMNTYELDGVNRVVINL